MKKISLILAVALLMVLTFAACQSTDQFLGTWESVVEETTSIEGEDFTFALIMTTEINEDNTWTMSASLQDEQAISDSLVTLLDTVKANTLSEAGITDEELDESMVDQYGQTWDEYVITIIDTQLATLNDYMAQISESGEWIVADNAVMLNQGDVAFDMFTLEGDVLTSSEGYEFSKAA